MRATLVCRRWLPWPHDETLHNAPAGYQKQCDGVNDIMKTQTSRIGEAMVIRLDSGDDILLSIREAVAQHGLKHALILGAMGSVRRYHVHVVETDTLPPKDVFLKGEVPLDILSLNGVIMNGRVHAHISFSGTKLTMGGHLEEGCQILSFGQVWLITAADADLTDWDRIGRIG